MKSEELFAALREMDEKYVLEAAPGADIAPSDPPNAARRPKSAARARKRTLPIAVAACLCALTLMGAAVLLPMSRKEPAETAGQEPSGALTGPSGQTVLPGVGKVPSDGRFTGDGDRYLTGDGQIGDPLSPLIMMFEPATVVEAKVVEILPDRFVLPGDPLTYTAVKLHIVDCIRGEGLPEEIWFRYPRWGSGLLDGFDSLILSVEQIGVENFMMLGLDSHRPRYFSDMFEVSYAGDVGFGSVIAFSDGVVDARLYDRAHHLGARYDLEENAPEGGEYVYDGRGYPAKYGYSPEKVKENIGILIETLRSEYAKDHGSADGFDEIYPFSYVTADRLLASDEAKALWETLTPSENNVFMQKFEDRRAVNQVFVQFTRVVNGFPTDEVYSFCADQGPNPGTPHLAQSGVVYTPQDRSSLPDIGQAIGRIDPAKLSPPNLAVSDDWKIVKISVEGSYQKREDRLYGIVKIVWRYADSDRVEHSDYRYDVYNSDGKGYSFSSGRILALIGTDDPADLDRRFYPKNS